MYNAKLQSSSVTICHNNFKYNIYWKKHTYYCYSNKRYCRKNLHGKCHPT